jgi:hypothetical protein
MTVCQLHADETTIDAIIKEFQSDYKFAVSYYKDKSFTFPVTLGDRVIPSEGPAYWRVKGVKPVDAVHLIIAHKTYRPLDELVVKAKLKSGIWDKEAQKIVFECDVEKEVNVKPPLHSPATMVLNYTKAPKKYTKEYEDKIITVRGEVQRVEDAGVALVLTPPVFKRNTLGKLIPDGQGGYQIEPQRALFVVKFADPMTVTKDRLDRGTKIEVTGKIGEMRGGVITMIDGKLEK